MPMDDDTPIRMHNLQMVGSGKYPRWDQYECRLCKLRFELHRSEMGREGEAVPKDCAGPPKPTPRPQPAKGKA